MCYNKIASTPRALERRLIFWSDGLAYVTLPRIGAQQQRLTSTTKEMVKECFRSGRSYLLSHIMYSADYYDNSCFTEPSYDIMYLRATH
jgi:hypothetical protein